MLQSISVWLARFDTTVAHALKPYGARRRMVCAPGDRIPGVWALLITFYNTAQRKGWFKIKAPFFTFTDRATGLKVGDPVNMMGFDVGRITEITANARPISSRIMFISNLN